MAPGAAAGTPGEAGPTVRVNGRDRGCPPGWTVADLLATLNRDPRTMAVERNGEIVPRSQHATTVLEYGDRLEIVIAVGGG